ncbi:Peptide chain release factor 3 OS=Ureibacillus acetophenoni OX=614649 GN=prfC PE=3 SV=1 [Ureibacillus acetophenoni]
MNWPIGMGKEFLGIYDRYNQRIEQFRTDEDNRFLPIDENGELAVDHPMKATSYYSQAMDDITLLNEAGNEFSEEQIRRGGTSPVFFGSVH